MEEIGVVKSIEGQFANVVVVRRGICEKCTQGTCHLTDEGAEIYALNGVKAEVGQKVRVVLQPYTYLKGSLIVYGIPALALVIGAVLGKEVFARYLSSMEPDTVSAIFAFGLFGLSFLLVKLWSRIAEKKVEYRPVIKEILKN
ncbi:MAG: SoxR reducing system RseC family protein [Nitrospirae bacterium]|nr:SoxR reducing system RseC family protein [Nitrospirota bacterium]